MCTEYVNVFYLSFSLSLFLPCFVFLSKIIEKKFIFYLKKYPKRKEIKINYI